MKQTPIGPVDSFDDPYVISAFNQTGAAVTGGDVAALNADLVNASYVAVDGGDTDWRRNAVAVTALNALQYLVVAAESIAAGALGRWFLRFQGKALVANGAAAGDFIFGGAGNKHFSVLADTVADLDALITPTALVGKCLVANASGAPALRDVIFEGVAWKQIVGGGG